MWRLLAYHTLQGDATVRSNGSGQGILPADERLRFEGGEFWFFGLVIAQGGISLHRVGATEVVSPAREGGYDERVAVI